MENKKQKGHIIKEVREGSIAKELEIAPGDRLLAINDQEIEDVFDYQYYVEDEYIEILIEKPDGEQWLLEVDKDEDEDLGIVFENGLIWFGAAVSIAEILTGTYFASLGFGRGLAAIVLGHIIGCAMLFAAGLISGKARRSAMETVKMSFGQKGSLLFVVLNIIQLVGWTGIMIFDGALAANGVWALGNWLWCLVIGGLIVLWILIGIENLGKINTVAMGALFVLTIMLSFVIFGKGTMHAVSDEGMSFGAAVELSVAMPLSWLPLISDYTREAEKPVKATAASAIVYGLVSCWMYLIGMGAAIFTSETDISLILLKSGLGWAALVIVILSTVTTTFLDAFSAGISFETISSKPRLSR